MRRVISPLANAQGTVWKRRWKELKGSSIVLVTQKVGKGAGEMAQGLGILVGLE